MSDGTIDGNLMADPVEFAERGFIVLPRLLPDIACESVIRDLERLSGRSRSHWERASAVGRATGTAGWTVPDGVVKHAEFWPLIDHRDLLRAVRDLLGPDARFLQHNDLHVGFSSFNWHRDGVSRRYGVGSDWDAREPYRLVRVGLYLQSNDGGFRFGVVPGTHAPPRPGEEGRRSRVERSAANAAHLRRMVTGRNPSPPGAEWLELGRGDAVIFDPRLIHTGTPADGPKYSVFLGYGVPGFHFDNHSHYYRHLRPELGYGDIPPELRKRLERANLFHQPGVPREEILGATIPPGPLSRLARRFRVRM